LKIPLDVTRNADIAILPRASQITAVVDYSHRTIEQTAEIVVTSAATYSQTETL
jgi:hypothetical protein